MTTTPTLNITLKRGEDYSVTGTITDEETGAPVDITGSTFDAVISHALNGPVLATFTVDILDGPGGQYERKMPRATIDALTIRSGVWDMFWNHPDGTRTKVLSGAVTIEEDVV
jgi:hypothetical protein